MKSKLILLVAMIGSVLGAGATELGGGWTLAMDPANAGRTNGWAAAARAEAKPAPAPGAYRLRAYLDRGGYAAAFEKGFYVTARPGASTGAVTVAPVPRPDFIDLGKVDEATGAAAMARVAAGATALVRLEMWGNKPPRFLPLQNLAVVPRSHWLYHDDTIMVPDTLTKGLKTGFLGWDFYEGCFPLFGFVIDTEPDSFASVNFNVGGPLVYNRSLNLATFRHGKGRPIVSTFPLDPASPAGATILANAAKF